MGKKSRQSRGHSHSRCRDLEEGLLSARDRQWGASSGSPTTESDPVSPTPSEGSSSGNFPARFSGHRGPDVRERVTNERSLSPVRGPTSFWKKTVCKAKVCVPTLIALAVVAVVLVGVFVVWPLIRNLDQFADGKGADGSDHNPGSGPQNLGHQA